MVIQQLNSRGIQTFTFVKTTSQLIQNSLDSYELVHLTDHRTDGMWSVLEVAAYRRSTEVVERPGIILELQVSCDIRVRLCLEY